MKSRHASLNALDSVSLEFSVPWPVNIVVNRRCMTVYNDIFRYLLQIKRVKYVLERLQFTGKAELLSFCLIVNNQVSIFAGETYKQEVHQIVGPRNTPRRLS